MSRSTNFAPLAAQAILLFIFLTVGSSFAARTIYAAPESENTSPPSWCGSSNNTPCRLADAFSQLENNDTIVLADGIYEPGYVVSDRNFTLQAAHWGAAMIGAYVSGDLGNFRYLVPAVVLRNSSALIQGVVFSSYMTNVIVVSTHLSSVIIENCTFTHLFMNSTSLMNSEYIRFDRLSVAGLAIYAEGNVVVRGSSFNDTHTNLHGFKGLAISAFSLECEHTISVTIEDSSFIGLGAGGAVGGQGASFYYERSPKCISGNRLSKIVVTRSIFSGNYIGLDVGPAAGAALALHGPSISVEIHHCLFDANLVIGGNFASFDASDAEGQSAQGAAIFFTNTGDRLLATPFSSLKIFDSVFYRNHGRGGDIPTSETVSRASGGSCYGGAINTNGMIYMIINSSVFDNNLCVGGNGGLTGGDAYGGAISMSFPVSMTSVSLPKEAVISLNNVTFSHNSLDGGLSNRNLIDLGGTRVGGAALYISSNGESRPKILITSCRFYSNVITAGSYGDAYGGAIGFVFSGAFSQVAQFTEISRSEFIDNYAMAGIARGGAVSFVVVQQVRPNCELILSHCEFSGNRAIGGIQGEDNTDAPSPPKNVAEGGAIHAVSPSYRDNFREMLKAQNSRFFNNSATMSLWVLDQDAIFHNVAGHARGGAIRLSGSGELKLIDSEFDRNTVSCVSGTTACAGGAVSAHHVNVNRISMKRNSIVSALPLSTDPYGYISTPDTVPSIVRGGALAVDYGFAAESSAFEGNSAIGALASGGAIFSGPSSLRLRSCNISHNLAHSTLGDAGGGGLEVVDDQLQLIHRREVFFSLISNNSVSTDRPEDISRGGGLSMFLNPQDEFRLLQIMNNRADFGAGMYISLFLPDRPNLSPEYLLNNSAAEAGGAIFINTNNNIARTIDGNYYNHTIVFKASDFSQICNSSAISGNSAIAYGSFCALPIDQMLARNMPSNFVWPGKLFDASFIFNDLLGNPVVSNSTSIQVSAQLSGQIHFLESDAHNGPRIAIPVDLGHTGAILPDARGEYYFPNLRVRLAPGTRFSITFQARPGPGKAALLYPSYTPTANHSFVDKIRADVVVTSCPPGFATRKLSDGTFDCSRCPPFTYSAEGDRDECVPCGSSESSGHSSHSEHGSSLNCLIPPSSDGTGNDIWVIPQGFFPVPSFNETEAILPCPNREACKQYNCSLAPVEEEHGHVSWKLDCTACDEAPEHGGHCSFCEHGYTDRLCSRCACNPDDINNCYFAANGEEFVCQKCEAPSTAVLASCGVLIILSLVGFLLFQHSAVAIFVAEVLIAILLLVLGLGEWWFFDVIIISTILFLISRSATKRLSKQPNRPSASHHNVVNDVMHDAQGAHAHSDDSNAAYFVGIIKVSLFFLQTTAAILPRGTWPSWISKIVELLNSVSLRIAGVECFNPALFSIPSVRFGILMSAPLLIIFVMGFATLVAVLLSKLAIIKRLQALEEKYSVRKCCKKSKKSKQPILSDEPIASDGPIDIHEEPSDAESDVEDSLLGHRPSLAHENNDHSPSFWLRLQYSTLFVLFASQFELSNVILSQLKPCEEGYMAMNPWIACSWAGDSTQYVWLQVLSYFFLLLYVVGIPALFFGLLLKNRNAIREGSMDVEHRMGFLYETYKRDVYFFEIPWLVRRILLSISLALLPTSSGFRTAAIALVLLSSLFVQQRFKPFSSDAVNTLETVSTTTLLYTFVVGTEVATSTSALRPTLQTLLWVLNAAVVITLICALVAPAVQRLFQRCCCQKKSAVRMLNVDDNNNDDDNQ